MTLQHVQNKLRQWKTDEIYLNSKSYKEHKSNMFHGEYIFVLTWRLDLRLWGISETILQTKLFQTQTLSKEPLSKNPDGDIYRLNQLLPKYDNDFIQTVEDAITKHLEDLNPNGFF